MLYTDRLLSQWQALRQRDLSALPPYDDDILGDFLRLAPCDTFTAELMSKIVGGRAVKINYDLFGGTDTECDKVRKDIRKVFAEIALEMLAVMIDKCILSRMSSDELKCKVSTLSQPLLLRLCGDDKLVCTWMVQLAVSLSHNRVNLLGSKHLSSNVVLSDLSPSEISCSLVACVEEVLKRRHDATVTQCVGQQECGGRRRGRKKATTEKKSSRVEVRCVDFSI